MQDNSSSGDAGQRALQRLEDEVKRLRTDLVALREDHEREMKRYRIMALDLQEGEYSPDVKRGSALTVWLIVLTISATSNCLGAFVAGFSWKALLIFALGIAGLVGVAGAWTLQKWGVYMLALIYAALIVLDLLAFNSIVSALVAGVGLLILLVLVGEGKRWDAFS